MEAVSRGRVALLCLAILVVAACGGRDTQLVPPQRSSLALIPIGAASGSPIRGASGREGVTVEYLEKGRFAIVFGVRNRSGSRMTVLRVEDLDRDPKLIHHVGTVFVPMGPWTLCESCPGPPESPPVQQPFTDEEPLPVLLPRRFGLGVQLNFELRGCGSLRAGERETVNRAVLFVFKRPDGSVAETRVGLGESRVTVTAPAACPS